MSCPDLAIPRGAAAPMQKKVTANDTLDRFAEAITVRLTIDGRPTPRSDAPPRS